MEEEIAVQQVNLKPDLMFGGGLSMFNKRKDNKDLVAEAVSKGYQFITTKQGIRKKYVLKCTEFDAKTSLPLIGLFANSHMDYEIDRDPAEQPSLREMVEKALDLLHKSSKDHKGFFLVIEASRIDMVGFPANFFDV